MRQAIRGSQHGETGIAGLAGFGENVVKRRRFDHAGAAREGGAAGLREQELVRELGSETLTPFGAAGFDNTSPTAGGHAGAKAVGAFAVNDARLKSALHN